MSVRRPRTLLLEARLPGLVGAGLGRRARGISVAGPIARGEDDAALPADHDPDFRLDALERTAAIPESLRPLVAIGGMVLVLFGVVQLMGNQFGFDRDGFRVFVLSPASRRDILLGKNLVFAPLVLGFAVILLTIVQIFCPLGLDHFLGMFPHFVSMFLLFCIFTNLMSIYTPVHVAAGSLKPSNPKTEHGSLAMLMFLVLFPLTQAPTLLPLGIEMLMRFMGWTAGLPIYLLLCLVECAVVVVIYYFSLIWLGRPVASPRAEDSRERDEPRVRDRRGCCVRRQRSACKCASTNQSHLSMPRDTSVNRSAVSRSPRSLVSSMAFRASLPKAARAEERASTWLRPSAILSGYSGSELRFATTRAVPSATPPSWTARSAISSTYSSISSLILSNSSCRPMKCGPLTFQWACLVCVCRSLQSASRALELDHFDASCLGQVILRLEHWFSGVSSPEALVNCKPAKFTVYETYTFGATACRTKPTTRICAAYSRASPTQNLLSELLQKSLHECTRSPAIARAVAVWRPSGMWRSLR